MSRVFTVYDIFGTTPHASATSTGTANIQTLTPPAGAAGCYVTVSTTAARVTFDGTNPGAGAAPGLVLPAGFTGLLPWAKTIKFASTAAANAEVNVLWLH